MGQAKNRQAEIQRLKSKAAPVLAVTHLETGKWSQCRAQGANAALFVGLTTPPNSVPIALLVNDGTMSDAEAKKLMEQSHSQYGTKLFAYVNLDDIEETVVSHTQGGLGQFMATALPEMLRKVGLLEQFKAMVLNTKNPAIKALVASVLS